MQGVIVQQQQHPSVHFRALPQDGPPPGMMTTSPGMPDDDTGGGIAKKSRMSQALGVRTTRLLGVAFLISGLTMVVLQIICTALVHTYVISSSHEAGAGIWCGIAVFICGILGSCAASYKTKALVISFLVFDALCVGLVAPTMIGFTGGDISIDYYSHFCYYNHDSDYSYDPYGARKPDTRWNCEYKKIMLTLTWFLLIDALFIFGISILGIVTNSVALKKAKGCCCCNESNVQPPIIIYVPANQMPAVIGQPSQYLAAPGQVDPPQPQSQAFQVPSAQPHEFSAVAAASPAPTYTAASASAYPTGTISEPPPYMEKI